MDSLKSLCAVWHTLARGSVEPEDHRTIDRRCNEGLKFFTKTLPSLGKALDAHLMMGTPLDLTDVRFGSRDGYPLFLGNHFRAIDCPSLADHQRAWHIKCVRQLTLLFYKMECPYDEETKNKAISGFLDRDHQVGSALSLKEKELTKRSISRALANADPLDIVPRHGPGAVSNRLRNSEKWHGFRFIPRLDAVFPYDSHFFFDIHHVSEEYSKLENAEVIQDPASRLVLVPKDSRGPRIICCEPSEFQYIQQGLCRLMYSTLERSSYVEGRIQFTDQSQNQELAKSASITGDLACLDLSDASDFVDWDLIQEVFPPRWVQAFQACRSQQVELPDGSLYGPLRKFCPMGSAVCFPVESLLFWALLRQITHDVWVYGDDIIVPSEHALDCIALLERAGLRVNRRKSCLQGSFRESCGGDYYAGYDVGYVKVRQVPMVSDQDVFYWGDLATQVADRLGVDIGLNVAGLCGTYVPRSSSAPQPGVFYSPDCPTAANDVFLKRRWSRDLQRWEYKIRTVRPLSRVLKGHPSFHWCELMRKVLTKDGETEVGSYTLDDVRTRWAFTYLGETPK